MKLLVNSTDGIDKFAMTHEFLLTAYQVKKHNEKEKTDHAVLIKKVEYSSMKITLKLDIFM